MSECGKLMKYNLSERNDLFMMNNCCNNSNRKQNCGQYAKGGCSYPKYQCQGKPVPAPLFPALTEPTEICCDCSGCKEYPTKCRNKFWPSFAHPRWLCCDDLYCAR